MTLETGALPNLGYEVVRHLGPGEIVRIDRGRRRDAGPAGRPHADLRVPVDLLRLPRLELRGHQHRGGPQPLRRGAGPRATDVRSTCVAGIPDSGVGHAIGYATEAGIPYRRPFVKYTPTWPRSFMPQEQRVRDLVARMKLIPIRELIDGQRLLFCEDSIVRGTQLRDIIHARLRPTAPARCTCAPPARRWSTAASS